MRAVSRRLIVVGPVLALALSACAGSPEGNSTNAPTAAFTPVTITNCGQQITVDKSPQKMVTLNQGATEVALALQLQDRMVGTAYLDDTISPSNAEAYKKVAVLSQKYPSKEQFLATGPDFAYASYGSAFTEKNLGTRDVIAKDSIGTYLSPFGCPKGTPKADASFDNVWGEVSDVAAIFGVTDRSTNLIDSQKKQLDEVRQKAAGQGKKIFWFDSGDKTPFVGAGAGGPQLLIKTVGATNIFEKLSGGWADGSWEDVVAAKPDVIVFAEASWDTAAKKQAYLEADPVLSQLDAVKNKRYVVIPFSATTPGIRLAEGASMLSDQLAALPK
ncbi:MAG: ABC transporter substrate-binding protein [Propionibacteriaceae bacterium]